MSPLATFGRRYPREHPIWVLLPIFAGLIASLGGFAIVLGTSARAQNARAQASEAGIAQAIVTELTSSLGQVVVSYAIWDEAYRQVAGPIEADWAAHNLGPDLLTNQGIEGTYIFSETGTPTYLFYDGNVPTQAAIDPKKSLGWLVCNALDPHQPQRVGMYKAGFVAHDGQIHLAVAREIEPTDPALRRPGTAPRFVLVLERALTPKLLDNVASLFKISNLHVATAPLEGEGAIPLDSPSHARVGFLAWTPSKPGEHLLMVMVPAALASFGMLALFSAMVLSNWLKLQRDLHQSQLAANMADHANRTKDVLISHLSHELRTPLNAIIGFSELISCRSFGNEPEASARYADYATEIGKSGHRLLQMINSILELARIESGARALDLATVDISDVLSPVAKVFSRYSPTANVKLVTTLAPNLPDLVCDSRAVRQIVLQLLDNAAKFAATGAEIHLKTQVSEDGRFIEIVVEDNGSGMTPEQLGRLEQPFGHIEDVYVADSAQRGIGMGLAICRTLAELHGGRLQVESDISPSTHGTRITVSLPLGKAMTGVRLEDSTAAA